MQRPDRKDQAIKQGWLNVARGLPMDARRVEFLLDDGLAAFAMQVPAQAAESGRNGPGANKEDDTGRR
jgi:hypothetical protein